MPHAVLPSPGTEFRLRCRASGAVVVVRSKSVVVDFDGSCQVVVESDPDRSDAVALRVRDLRLVAELPDAGGPEDGGVVTLEQTGSRTDGTGVLRALSDSSPGFAGDLVVVLTGTVRQPDGSVEVVARRPSTFSATRTAFPPHGDEYELAEPVDLALAEAPEATVVRLEECALRLDPT